MANYKWLHGTFEYRGRTYKEGQIISTTSPLDTIFKNKCVRIEEIDAPARSTEEAVRSSVKGPSTDKPPEVFKNPDEGNSPEDKPRKDVTKSFSRALDEEYFVFRIGRKYYVQDSDKPGVDLNKEPLKKADVDAFIRADVED